jgi:hypothetical protein
MMRKNSPLQNPSTGFLFLAGRKVFQCLNTYKCFVLIMIFTHYSFIIIIIFDIDIVNKKGNLLLIRLRLGLEANYRF